LPANRGIVACANENREHSNGSQFFLTLGPTESLQKKHTIFGRVGGETIYNLMEMNNLEVDDGDRCFLLPISSNLARAAAVALAFRAPRQAAVRPAAWTAVPCSRALENVWFRGSHPVM